MALAPGDRIGPYEIVAWIGAGGMGEVYRARDSRLGRDVAIKLIAERFAADPSRLRRFEQEARAAGQINHPNILAVYDIGSHAGAAYIVSELLEGEPLSARVKHGPVPPRKAVEYARQIADGLSAAHDKGLVHRDLKPDNLFITVDDRIKILDFGIAKLALPSDEPRPAGSLTETAEGTVMGSHGYMSPEQVRGETVDVRSDIFSVGSVLYEMLAGRPAFLKGTGAETMAAILKEEPPEPAGISSVLLSIVSRCLGKAREARFQSARDLAFSLQLLPGTATGTSSVLPRPQPQSWKLVAGLLALALGGAMVVWQPWRTGVPAGEALAEAQFSLLTNWEGAEEGAEISPDGKLVAFLSDAAGEWDLWRSQIGSQQFLNLTADFPPLSSSGFIVRKLGFSADGEEIWFNPGDGKAPMLIPSGGGKPRPFLPAGTNTPAWSPDTKNIVFVDKSSGADPMFVANRAGANPRQIVPPGSLKNMNPVYSTDGQWIYFARGAEPQDEIEMDAWRVPSAGGEMERLSQQHLAMNFLTPLDPRTLLFVARDESRSGPWLWSFDVDRRLSRRVPAGVDQFTSVSASRDGQRIVVTVANPSAGLWTVPIRDQAATEADASPYPLTAPTGQALAPRFGGTALFYLSARGTRDGLWKEQNGTASDVWRGIDGAISEPPAVSPDGTRVVVTVRREGKRHLEIMAADGTGARTVAGSIEIDGAAGQSAADWSPDGTKIVTAGHDAAGPALFVIPVDTGVPVRLLDGQWVNPVWSPVGDLIVYAGRSLIGQVELHGIREDRAAVTLPTVMVRPGGYRFLPDGRLVYLPRIPSLDFWVVDLSTGAQRQLTQLANKGTLRTFDITRDGKRIVFDRSRQNSNIALIELTR